VASTAARAYLCVGIGAIVLHFVRGGDDVLVYDAIGIVSSAVILGATFLRRPSTWRAWTAIGISQALMAVGDVIYDNFTTRYPGPADVFYLLGVATLIVGAALLGTATDRRDIMSHLDALLVTFGVGIAAWMLAFNGVGTEGSASERIVSVAYPLADVLLLGVLIRLAFVQGRRKPSYWLLLAGVTPLFVADGAWVVPSLEQTYAVGTNWADAGWLLSYVLLAAAALEFSMGQIVEPTHRRALEPLSLRRVTIVGAALILAPASVAVAELWHHSVDIVVVCSAATVLLTLVVLRFVWIVRELETLRTQAVESERKFRMVFERAPVGISIGRSGVMQETNPALQEMLGYSSSELARMHYTEVTHADDLDVVEQQQLDDNQRQSFSIDKRYVRKDGSMIDAHVHVALDLDDGLGISLIEDVTGRRELEEQLRQSQKMEAIGKLAGGIAHDFNNLMTAVMGYSDLLLQQLDGDERAVEKVTAIRESAVRASDLTRQLLAFGRRQTLQADDVDLRDVVMRMDSLLRRLIGEDIQLDTIFGAEPVVVRADQTQLEQVVMNLVVNARDAMPGGGTLTVAVVSNGESANLSVIDSGVGMDDETLERIFEPFFTTKARGEGSGLGLSTVHGIVGQSGGSVHVETEPGVGTAFTIRFPLAGAEGLPVEPAAATLVD
jgi:PAS domain S-box-containing protein